MVQYLLQFVPVTALAMEQYIVPIEDMDMKPVYSDLQVVQVPHDEVGVSYGTQQQQQQQQHLV